MCFSMQSFLNVHAEVRDLDKPPEELISLLTASGWPPLKSATKLMGPLPHGETFELEFASIPANAPVHPGGDGRLGMLHVLDTALTSSPIFAPGLPASATLMQRALEVASAGAAANVPHVWMTGELARRGTLRRVPYVLLERVAAASTTPGLSVPAPLTAAAATATAGYLPRYDDAFSLIAELRKLAVVAGATELDEPLANLSTACRDKWNVQATPPQMLLLSSSNGKPSGTSSDAGPDDAPGRSRRSKSRGGEARLDSGASWATACVCDPRILHSEESPWDLVRAACHVVKARWLIDLLRRTPGTAPRCELVELLRAHDAGQALLAERGWLPASVVAPGSSCARLAETFPEEICPNY